MAIKLVEVERGKIVESIHRGDIAVVSSEGKLLLEVGKASRLTFFRSASKPFQTIAALEQGIKETFQLNLREIAIFASSHSGESRHVETLGKILRKADISLEELECGIHEPLNKEAARELIQKGERPTSLHCNCSGKHIGIMLAHQTLSKASKGYMEENQLIQKEINRVISDFANIPEKKLIKGIDGCEMPVHGVPLKNIAEAYANLSNLKHCKGKYQKSQKDVLEAMTTYPEMVAGEGRLDTELMKHFGDRMACKMGAEGLFGVSLIKKSIGIALKIEDGNTRAIGPAILHLLIQLDEIKPEEAGALMDLWQPKITSHKDQEVGRIVANYKVNFKL